MVEKNNIFNKYIMPKGIRKLNKETSVKLPLANTQEIAIPEFFANKNVSKKTGKITYKLVNPLTKSRNLSNRNGEPSIKLIRKPVEHMIIMNHQTEPISLSLFSKKDRDIINTHFKVVQEHKDKHIKEIPSSKPFQNKERGRPEILPTNIKINKERKKAKQEEAKKEKQEASHIKLEIKKKIKINKTPQSNNIILDIDEPQTQPESEIPKTPIATKRGRKIKYQTDEERKAIIKKQKAESAKRIYEAKKKAKSGKGIIDYGKALIYGRNDYQPKVRKILSSVGDKKIKEIELRRTPLSFLLNSTLNAISLGEFEKNKPFDKLYHLSMVCLLDNGQRLLIEKNEVINMILNPKLEKDTETKNISINRDLTVNELMENTKKRMGDEKFYKYDANENNCQQFIVNILRANNLNTPENEKFVFQDLKTLFKKLPFFTKPIIDKTTELGAKINVLTQGAGIKEDTSKVLKHLISHITDPKEPVDKRDYKQSKMLINDIMKMKMKGKGIDNNSDSESSSDGSSDSDNEGNSDNEDKNNVNYIVQSVIFDKNKYDIKSSRKWLKENGYKSSKVDIEPNTLRFRQLDPKKMEKEGYTKYRNKKLGKSGISLVISYKGAEGGAIIFFGRDITKKPKGKGIKKNIDKNNISNNNIMPKFVKGSKEAKEHMARIRNMKGKGLKEDAEDVFNKAKGYLGLGLKEDAEDIFNKAKGYLGLGINEPQSRKYGAQPMMGYGSIHHHHHYHMNGMGWEDDLRNAFDPNKNGVSKAFDPNQNGLTSSVNNTTNAIKSSFESGGDANKFFTRQLPSFLIHQGIPEATGYLGGLAAEALVPEGGPISFFAGKQLGKYAGQKGADELGRQTGYGFKKGSKEAKEHMAKIRAMKKN